MNPFQAEHFRFKSCPPNFHPCDSSPQMFPFKCAAGGRIIESILLGACLKEQLFKHDTVGTIVQTVSRLNINSSLHMRQSKQLFRRVAV